MPRRCGTDKPEGSDAWKVAKETIAGKITFVLGCDRAEVGRNCDVLLAGRTFCLQFILSLSSCCCILPVRKSRDITDPARKDAAAKHLAKHEATKPKTLMKGFYPALKHKRVKFYINRNQPVESRRIALLLNSQIK